MAKAKVTPSLPVDRPYQPPKPKVRQTTPQKVFQEEKAKPIQLYGTLTINGDNETITFESSKWDDKTRRDVITHFNLKMV